MKMKQLICDPNGNISQGKVWSNIVKLPLVDSPHLPEMFLWYLGVVSGSELGKKFMTMKLSHNNVTKGE
jgi:hypothetical protein